MVGIFEEDGDNFLKNKPPLILSIYCAPLFFLIIFLYHTCFTVTLYFIDCCTRYNFNSCFGAG